MQVDSGGGPSIVVVHFLVGLLHTTHHLIACLLGLNPVDPYELRNNQVQDPELPEGEYLSMKSVQETVCVHRLVRRKSEINSGCAPIRTPRRLCC